MKSYKNHIDFSFALCYNGLAQGAERQVVTMKQITISEAVRILRAGSIVWDNPNHRYACGMELEHAWRLSGRAIRKRLLRFRRMGGKGLYAE